MLEEICIKNLAVIEKQTVGFGSGLNVITGETGSGKSLVLHAIEIILGAKPRPNIIRAGEEVLEVSAVFNLSKLDKSILSDLPDIAQGEELSIVRSLSRAGKGKIYINGSLGSLSLLSQITGRIINICGQSQHIRLLDPQYHLELIDGYANLGEDLEVYKKAYRDFKEADSRVKTAEISQAEGLERRNYFENVLEDLVGKNIRNGLRQELESEVKRLSGGEKLLEALSRAQAILNDDGAIQSSFRAMSAELQEVMKIDDNFLSTLELFNTAKESLRDFESDLKKFASKVEIDEDLLNQKRDELAEVARLERKYKRSDSELSELLSEAKRELSVLDSGSDLSKLKIERDALKRRALEISGTLTKRRKAAANNMAKDVAEELFELNMKETSLSVKFDEREMGFLGTDKAEILISTVKEEPQKPLRQIASGGELSRIMLVLKKILKERSGVNILVFDEVDVGVSGSVARAVGQKLKALAENSQVICITHLPQVASLADIHLLVDKKEAERTCSIIKELSKEEKLEEVARMLAGFEVTEATRSSARELLNSKM